MEDRIYDYWVATLQDGYIGNIVALTEAAGGAKSLYERFKKGRYDHNEGIMLTEKLRRYIAERWKNQEQLEREYYTMLSMGISYVNYKEKSFPEKLKNIPSPPYGLFVKGILPNPGKKSVAIVGARECSEYGRVCAEYFGDRLAREGIQVISGMAWGIDGISQMSAIQAGGNSFAVLGCGVDVIYPRKNNKLYEMLCENGNGLISEYAPGTMAQARSFPPRNRIISGLCDVLLVVEAKAKSGTLITVNLAVEQGKCVMAVPGRITDELSYGCLSLIREGASLAINIDSVLEELQQPRDEMTQLELDLENDVETMDKSNNSNADRSNGSNLRKHIKTNFDSSICGNEENMDKNLEDKERTIMNVLSLDPITTDYLAELTQMSVSEVLITLSRLDLKGCVKEIGIGEYVRK